MEEKIRQDLKASLKEGNKTKISVLRMVLSAIKNKKIEEGSDELDGAKITAILQKIARQHEESIKQFGEGKREDLVNKETEELEILKHYLPEPITGEELDKIISESIANAGAASVKDMGKVMKDVMEKTAGRADGKLVSQKVKERLA